MRLNTVKSLFKNIIDSLTKKDDGTYIFKNGKYYCSSQIIFGGNDFEDSIPSKESIFEYFEKEILSIIPNAILFLYGDTSIAVDISVNNILTRRIFIAKKEIDIYEALKTLFFPTLKEFIVKFGKNNPEWIYLPYRTYEVEVYDIDNSGEKKGIRFSSSNRKIMRPSKDAAIDFLAEDINYTISTLKFRNPIPFNATKLPQKDISIEELESMPKIRKKSFFIEDFYSFSQKIKFIEQLFKDFIEYYKYIILNNFPNLKNSFFLFSNFPIRISIYIRETTEPLSNVNPVSFTYTIEKLDKKFDNQVKLFKNQDIKYDPDKHISFISTMFSSFLIISHLGIFTRTFSPTHFVNPYNSQRNALPFTYVKIREELDEILEKIQFGNIFDEIKPYISDVESWIQMIIDAEERGNEDYYIELKSIPTESPNKDGSGNDIYSEINAFENAEGGYLFIGVDEKKKGVEKIVGLESYFRDHNKNLDMVKREIIDKCIKYLRKTYRIDSGIYNGKTIIRIKVSSNFGSINWFKPEKGNECAYLRDNGKIIVMKSSDIERRLRGIS